MRVLYLIGNGFDLAQNLKTKYSDFYEASIVESKEEKKGVLKKLQESIQADVPSWADMEKRLGEFTAEMGNVQDVDTVYDYLRGELRNYLLQEQKKVSLTTGQELINRALLSVPERGLPPESADAIRSIVNTLTVSNKTIEIDVVSFNYTDVFERAINYNGKPLNLEKINDSISVKLNSVYKVHGALDREMVMGVADTTQIANKQLAADIDAMDVLVKPHSTALRRDYVTSKCQKLISNADLIVMYGLSIGETDRNWWKLVTDRVGANGNVRLIIYSHLENNISHDDYPRMARKEREIYKKLYTCNGLTDIKYTRMNRQIFVSFDDTMFKEIMK